LIAIGLDSDLWEELMDTIDPGWRGMDNVMIGACCIFHVAKSYDKKDGYVWYSDYQGHIRNEKLP
jgi:hypothetical protein